MGSNHPKATTSSPTKPVASQRPSNPLQRYIAQRGVPLNGSSSNHEDQKERKEELIAAIRLQHSSVIPVARSENYYPSGHSPLKKCLIVFNKEQEPQHFFKCIKEKLSSFVEHPIVLDSDAGFHLVKCKQKFLSGVDVVDQRQFALDYKLLLSDYELVAFTLYSGVYYVDLYLDESMRYLKQQLEEHRNAVLFLRGNTNSIPSRLGYVNPELSDGFVDFANRYQFQINVKEINKLCNNSSILSEFRNNYFPNVTNNWLQFQLGDEYICGITNGALTKPEDWYLLGNDGSTKNSLLLHKRERALFTPWYGFSHGYAFNTDLVAYFCKFLLYEYWGKPKTYLVEKLFQKHERDQLIDLVVLFID